MTMTSKVVSGTLSPFVIVTPDFDNMGHDYVRSGLHISLAMTLVLERDVSVPRSGFIIRRRAFLAYRTASRI